MSSDRRGFTLIELLTVIIVMGVLAGIAVTRYIDIKRRALSTHLASDLNSVRLAAYGAMYSIGDWPPEQPAGVVPPEMQSQLGTGFKFKQPEYTLDWENLGGSGGGMQVGVTVTSDDPALMQAVSRTLGNKGPFIMVGNQLTFVIIGPDGQG
jgi:prepilin-type N-terminal cleavage/methylation domain-containing protein